MLSTDNRMTLADLLSMQQDNTDPSVQYSTGQSSLSSLTRGRTEEEINKLLSGMQMRTPGFDPNFMAGDPYMPPQQMPQNYVQRGNNAPIDMDQRQPMPQNYIQRGNSAPIDLGQSRRQHDVYADGPELLSRQQQPDGTFLVTKRVPARDGDGRMTSAVRQYIETPDYLNPAKLKEMQFKQAMQKLSEGNVDEQLKRAQLAEMMGFDPRSMGGAVSSKPRDLKLKPGEVWNPQTQKVEAVEGSDIYNKQRGAFAQDKDTLDAVKLKTNSAKAKIEEILGSKKDPITGEVTQDDTGFQRNFGGYNAYLSQYFPGAGSDTRKNIESLKSDLKMAGLELIRSGGSVGQMTQQEWPIVEGMIASISPTLSEPEAKYQLGKVMAYMDNIAKKAETKFQNEWEGSQFSRTKPQTSGKHVTVTNDAEYNALPKGAIYITPTGETRTKR